MQRSDQQNQQQQQQQQSGRQGEAGHQGGASKTSHLRPEIDAKDSQAAKGGQIAQNRQQSSGQGSGQS